MLMDSGLIANKNNTIFSLSYYLKCHPNNPGFSLILKCPKDNGVLWEALLKGMEEICRMINGMKDIQTKLDYLDEMEMMMTNIIKKWGRECFHR